MDFLSLVGEVESRSLGATVLSPSEPISITGICAFLFGWKNGCISFAARGGVSSMTMIDCARIWEDAGRFMGVLSTHCGSMG